MTELITIRTGINWKCITYNILFSYFAILPIWELFIHSISPSNSIIYTLSSLIIGYSSIIKLLVILQSEPRYLFQYEPFYKTKTITKFEYLMLKTSGKKIKVV